MKKASSLYIHIPFCKHLCGYCDFPKMFYLLEYVKPYVNCLIKQISDLKERKFNTIYVGGGTPSSLSSALLLALLKSLKPHLKRNAEFTIEVNVETLTKEKIKIMKMCGVNRVSIGIQSFNDEILSDLNRKHNTRQIKYWIHEFQKEGITNINGDLIYGLPHQSKKDLKHDLSEILKLNLTHISTYALTISKHTEFYNRHLQTISEDKSREYYDLIYKTLTRNGFERYEVSNFVNDKHYSKHNLNYWHANEYVAFGLGAHGYENNVRYQYTMNIKDYIESQKKVSEETLTTQDQIEEFLMLNLRLRSGFKIQEFNKRFGNIEDFEFYPLLLEYKKENLIVITKNSVRTTYEGMMILDYLLVHLFLKINR